MKDPAAQRPIYFDNHATTPVDPRVLEAMLPYFTEHFGNAESSQHVYGWKAKSAVDRARTQIANLLGADAAEIIFTSGATESIHSAILGFLDPLPSGRHIITSVAEHKATLEVCSRATKLGHELTVLPVNQYGQVTAEQVESAIKDNTVLVSLMHGNNEIGSLNPISEIGELLRARGEIAFHVDAAQTAGKDVIDVRAMNIDLLSISAHKLYGPKGVGALFVRRTSPRVHIAPYLVGGGQERGLRGGTHNVPGIVGLGKACEIAQVEMPQERTRLTGFRDHLVETLVSQLDGVILNGHPTERLCNNVNLTVRGVGTDQLLLGLRDVAYSSASACSSGTTSHVLKAIGRDTDDPLTTTIRFGLGRFTTREEVDIVAERVIETVRNARGVSQGYKGALTEVP